MYISAKIKALPVMVMMGRFTAKSEKHMYKIWKKSMHFVFTFTSSVLVGYFTVIQSIWKKTEFTVSGCI